MYHVLSPGLTVLFLGTWSIVSSPFGVYYMYHILENGLRHIELNYEEQSRG
jgi:hypothetical protein